LDFNKLRQIISDISNDDSFENSTKQIEKVINNCNKQDLIQIISEIGVIPETIEHDSSEEKLFSKTTDFVLARAFSEIGIKSIALKERANSADVIATSRIHGYSLVADAKAFMLSRTAKNQKDFKVKSMVDWKQDSDYSVLVCPYFQYPKSSSQIYAQAIEGNVCLFSWEQMQFLLENNIHETRNLSLAPIWNISDTLRTRIIAAETHKKSNFIEAESSIFCSTLNIAHNTWIDSLQASKNIIM
jgi:type II restriction enzyme